MEGALRPKEICQGSVPYGSFWIPPQRCWGGPGRRRQCARYCVVRGETVSRPYDACRAGGAGGASRASAACRASSAGGAAGRQQCSSGAASHLAQRCIRRMTNPVFDVGRPPQLFGQTAVTRACMPRRGSSSRRRSSTSRRRRATRSGVVRAVLRRSRSRAHASMTFRGQHVVAETKAKYVGRPSPPYPANKMCGATARGNDGAQYKSKPCSTGVCRWVRV